MGSGRRRGLTSDCIRAGLEAKKDWDVSSFAGSIDVIRSETVTVLMGSTYSGRVLVLILTFVHVDGEGRWIDS
jgi:hypothetical protein